MTDPTTKPWEQLTVAEARERINAEREAWLAKHAKKAPTTAPVASEAPKPCRQ